MNEDLGAEQRCVRFPQGDTAPVFVHHPAHEGKTDAVAGHVLDRAAPGEAHEQIVGVLDAEARAVVAHAQDGAPIIPRAQSSEITLAPSA